MGDAFQTSVGESILQGAQVFNQAVAIYLQDRRAQANFEQRQKEAADLAKIREDKLKMEREAFELEQQVSQLRMEQIQAQTMKTMEETRLLPEMAAIKRASLELRTESSRVKTLRDYVNLQTSYQKNIFGVDSATIKNIEMGLVGTSLGNDSNMKPFENSTIQQLGYAENQLLQEKARLMGASEFEYTPEEVRERLSSIDRSLQRYSRAKSIRLNQVNQEVKKRRDQFKNPEIEQALQIYLGDQGTVPTEKDVNDAVENAQTIDPGVTVEGRIKNLDTKVKELETTGQGPLLRGHLKEEDLDNLANEFAALMVADRQKGGTVQQLIQRLWNKLDPDDQKVFDGKMRARLQELNRHR